MRRVAPFCTAVLVVAAMTVAALVPALPVAAAAPLAVPLTVLNREAVALADEPVTSGVPFAAGAVASVDEVRVVHDGQEVPSQRLRTASWPDGSVRWLLLDLQVDLPPSAAVQLTLETGTPAPVTGVVVDDRVDTLTVATGSAVFSFTKAELAVAGNRFLVDHGGASFAAVPDAGAWVVEEVGPLKAVVRVDGHWYSGGSLLRDELVRWRVRLVFHRGSSVARVFATFRNNASYGWDGGTGAQPDLVLAGAELGAALLPFPGSYVLGSGVEKTWEVDIAAAGAATRRETRYDGGGAVAAGFQAPRPLALAPPWYYAATRAWGRLSPPVNGVTPERREVFERFEKMQRAKVLVADVEDPPGLTGITLWQHLAVDLASWHDYGDLRWGGDTGSLSGNHYDWSFGMYLQLMRSGIPAFADAARVMAAHEIDLDLYHTLADGPAFNAQKNWESRPSHDNPGNGFGGGRPSHTWMQGYALHWLLTGDRRGLDAVAELGEGIRQYLYESFNGEGYVDTSEIRIHGWLVENLLTLWRLDPTATVATTSFGTKTLPEAMADVLQAVLDREDAAGGGGFVDYGDYPPDPSIRQPLQHLYFVEPAMRVTEEALAVADPPVAASVDALIGRMTDWLISVTYGGDTAGDLYRPLQIPYWVDLTQPAPSDGQLPYLLMAANAAAYRYLLTDQEDYRSFARRAFRDYVRYVGVTGGDAWVDPALRTPTAYNSAIFVDTESKVHGWSSRYGQYVLLAEAEPAEVFRDDFEDASTAAWSVAQTRSQR